VPLKTKPAIAIDSSVPLKPKPAIAIDSSVPLTERLAFAPDFLNFRLTFVSQFQADFRTNC
jgi:hypothetical protein